MQNDNFSIVGDFPGMTQGTAVGGGGQQQQGCLQRQQPTHRGTGLPPPVGLQGLVGQGGHQAEGGGGGHLQGDVLYGGGHLRAVM